MPSLHAAGTRCRRPPPVRHLVACAVLALLSQAPTTTWAQVPTALAATAAVGFVLPAQPLEQSLEQLARQARLQLLADPALLRGVRGRAVSAAELPLALAQLLQGSGLRGRLLGSTILVDAAASGEPSPSVLPEVHVVAAAPRETATGPVGGQIARRSATATKTDTALVEIPQSISVVTREELQNRKSDSLADALEYTAGFSAQPNGFARVADDFTLRGFNVGSGTGGMLRDGMKLQSSVYDGSIEPYGLERVEVLKGASSVLYGQLSPGGLINTVSKRPTDTPLREVGVSTGSFDRKQVTADLGGPIDAEGVWSWRLTALARDSGTDVDHVKDDRRYLAPALTWRPNAATSVTALASVQQIRSGFAPPLSYNITRLGNNTRARVQPGQFVGEPGFDRFDSDMQTLGYLVQHEFNDRFTLRHALRRYNADVDWDYSQVNTSVSAAGLLQRAASIRREHSSGTTSDTSLEWRSGQGAWQHTVLAGVDSYDKRYTSHRFTGTMQPINLLAPVYGTAVVPNFATDSGSDLSSRQWGVYLQDQVRFQERWVVLAGLRHDNARSDTTTLRTGAVASKGDSKTTGRAGLVYLAPNGLAPYLSYSQSFYPADGTARDGSSFVPTEGEQWEAGVRWQPAGSQTLLSAALYRLTQNNALTVDPVDSRYNVQTGQVRSQGLELEARHTLSSNLSVRAAYTYTDARTTQDNVAANVGVRTVGVPRHALALWSDYKLAGFGLSAWRAGAGVRAQDSTITTSPGTPTSVPGYGMLDLMLGWAPDTHWDFTLRVQNAADRSYVFCNTACRYGNARTAIAALNYRW